MSILPTHPPPPLPRRTPTPHRFSTPPSAPALMQQSSQILPPLPPFTLSAPPPPPSLTLTNSISDSSPTPFPDKLSLPTKPLPLYRSDLHSSLSPLTASIPDLLPPTHLEQAGYIPILPRTNSASGLFKKRCETCGATHDGSFGAGRFCSSRCARTVGGLAHRKKRMLERGAKARNAAEMRLKKRVRTAAARQSGSESSSLDRGHLFEEKTGGFRFESPRSMMTIGALLNPSE